MEARIWVLNASMMETPPERCSRVGYVPPEDDEHEVNKAQTSSQQIDNILRRGVFRRARRTRYGQRKRRNEGVEAITSHQASIGMLLEECARVSTETVD